MKTVDLTGGGKRPLVAFDEIQACPKCGGTDLNRAYHQTTHGPCDLFEFEPKCCEFEHHCRRCQSCGFKWAEEVLKVTSEGQGR